MNTLEEISEIDNELLQPVNNQNLSFNFDFTNVIGDLCFVDENTLITGEDKMVRIWDL